LFKASLARFYGWNDRDISSMPYKRAVMYWRAINILEGRESLVKLNISDYPKMKNDGRKKLFRSLRKEAYPRHLQKTMEFDAFAQKVGMTNG